MSTIKLNKIPKLSPINHPVIFSILALFQSIILIIVGKSNLLIIEKLEGSTLNFESIGILQLLGIVILTEIFSNLIQKSNLKHRGWLRKFINIVVSFTILTILFLILSFITTSPMIAILLFTLSLLTSLITTTYVYLLLVLVNSNE